MAQTPARLIADLRAQLATATATDLSAKARAALIRAERTVETIVQQGVVDFANGLPICDLPENEHLAAHRPGRPPKITTDPELQSFIAARATRMTFQQLATEVAEHFPKERRVGKSAIHAWWQKYGKKRDRPG